MCRGIALGCVKSGWGSRGECDQAGQLPREREVTWEAVLGQREGKGKVISHWASPLPGQLTCVLWSQLPMASFGPGSVELDVSRSRVPSSIGQRWPTWARRVTTVLLNTVTVIFKCWSPPLRNLCITHSPWMMPRGQEGLSFLVKYHDSLNPRLT